MRCKLCRENISPDCMLNIEICVFCYYDCAGWDSNGQAVTREEAILTSRGDIPKRKRKFRPRFGLPALIRTLVPYLVDCVIVALVRMSATSAVDMPLLNEVLSRFGFRVLRVNLEGVACSADVATRLASAIERDVDDLDVVMQMFSGLQEKHKLAVIVENFQDVARLPIPTARGIEGVMRGYCQRHRNAAWLFTGTQEMLPAFSTYERPFFKSGFVLSEEDICRRGRYFTCAGTFDCPGK